MSTSFRTLIVIIASWALASATARAADSFAWANPSLNGSALQALDFADDLHGWAVGHDGVVLRTQDGGDTWRTLTWNVLPRLDGVLALDATTLIAVGAGIFRSTDAGDSWTEIASPTAELLRTVAPAGGSLRAGGDHGVMLNSDDGGLTWTLLSAPADEKIVDQHWLDADRGIVTSGLSLEFQGGAYGTDDGGLTWTTLNSGFPPIVEFRDDDYGLIYGSPPLVTEDGGLTWTSAVIQDFPYATDVVFLADGRLLVSASGEGAQIGILPPVGGTGLVQNSFYEIHQFGVTDMVRLPGGRIAATLAGGLVIVSDDDGGSWSCPTPNAAGVVGRPITDLVMSDGRFGLALSSWYASQDPTVLLRTDDVGRSWQASPVPAEWARVTGFRVNDAGLAFAVGRNETTPTQNLARSRDGGASWTGVELPLSDQASRVAYLDETSVLISASSGRLWRSGDEGATWVQAGSTAGFTLTVLEFASPQTGFAVAAVGGARRLYRSTDGGATWQLRGTLPGLATAVDFFDDQTGLLNTWEGVYRTVNGGAVWTRVLQATDELRTSGFRPDGRGFALGDPDQPLMLTEDFGDTWRAVALPWTESQPEFPQSYTRRGADWTADGLLIGGPYAGILKLGLDASATAVAATPAVRATLRAAPNPFNPRTVLSFTLPEAGPAVVEIFDPRGRRVRVLAEGTLAAGAHTAAWNGRDDAGRPQPAGVYLARVRSAGAAASLKLLLVE